ncbi:succinylglutamate desuccinylase/aspartoacylase family protein [Devosia sp. 1566]|uniref:succinylglutamate desuccinylase/aspartoacylase family protein n=1 Tax=Devosia sp. 1566 TaxID=2499144 RepID=UPI000FDA6DEC|nr:succinylglutamate desuccinylase/aspartoacylase family protein [Devosia sp. 1566]
MEEIIIGSARSSAAGTTTGWLQVASLTDGSPVNAPVVIKRGAQDGPVLWLHGCVHGDEYCGTFVIHEFLNSIDTDTLKGTVVAIPVLNVSAFQSKRRMSPFEGFNGGDLNRQFPGSTDGSLTQQIAHELYAPLKQYADVLIDFHTALTPDVRWALFPKVEGEVGKLSERVAHAFGYRDTLPAPTDILVGSAFMQAPKDGIASFIAEVGGKGRSFTQDRVTDAAERLNNVLRALGMIEGDVTDYGPMTYFSNFDWVTATQGGLFERSIKCGDPVAKGDVIGKFYNGHGQFQGDAISPNSGIVLAIHSGPVMASGETLIHIGLDPQPAPRLS